LRWTSIFGSLALLALLSVLSVIAAPSRHPPARTPASASSIQLAWLAVIHGLPDTIFINRSGRVVEVHSGAYDTATTLEQDVQRCALGVRTAIGAGTPT
jgi:hypothetical protein